MQSVPPMQSLEQYQTPAYQAPLGQIEGVWLQSVNAPIQSAIDNYTPPPPKVTLPEVLPKTGPDPQDFDLTWALSQLWGNVMQWDDIQTIRSKFPEFDYVPDDVLSSLGANILQGDDIDTIMQKFPELQQNRSVNSTTQWWYRGDIGQNKQDTNALESVADWLNLPWKLTEVVDDITQKIPVVQKKQVQDWLNKNLGGFGADTATLPTMVINAVPSLLKTVTATARWVTNPYDTIKWVGKLFLTENWRAALKERYGSLEALWKLMEEDPVWLASDILTVVQLWAGWSSKLAWLAKFENTASKLWQFADDAGGAANVWADIIPEQISKLADQGGVMWTLGTYAEAVTAPVKTAGKLFKKATWVAADQVPSKEFLTRDLPISRIEKDIGLTPTERASVEDTGITAGEFMLKENLAWLDRGDQVNKLQQISDDNYNWITNKLQIIPETERIESKDAKKALKIMVNEMERSDILKEDMADYIVKLRELIDQTDYSPSELNAIRRDFDRIIGYQLFDSKWRVSGIEDKVLAAWRRNIASEVEEVANKYGIDIMEMNKDMRRAIVIRDGLLRRLSQENKNNTFGLQDIWVWAILAAWDPITATAVVIGKKAVERAIPSVAQKLYNSNKAPYGKNINMSRGVTIPTRDTTRGLSLSPSTATNGVPTRKVKSILWSVTENIRNRSSWAPLASVLQRKRPKETFELKWDIQERVAKSETDQYNRGNNLPLKSSLMKKLSKYKSVQDLLKDDKPIPWVYFRWQWKWWNVAIKGRVKFGLWTYMTNYPSEAKRFWSDISVYELPKGLKLLKANDPRISKFIDTKYDSSKVDMEYAQQLTDKAKRLWYDGIDAEGTIVVFDNSKVQWVPLNELLQ